MTTLSAGIYSFQLSDPLPVCDQWRRHMPANRDPDVYRVYMAARKLWRSKIAWEFTRDETQRILADVQFAHQKGDWGASALLAYFYLHGLGPLASNHVLDKDADKAVEIARAAAAKGLPWGFYDLGVAHEHGYGGANHSKDIAWGYYVKAAQLGSPDAQLALADAYSEAGRFEDEKSMLTCAYRQGHGPAAHRLGLLAKVRGEYKEAVDFYQEGTKFGSVRTAAALSLLFEKGYWRERDDQMQAMSLLGIAADLERRDRYVAITEALEINPDLRLSRLDAVLPLPPAKLPPWRGIEDALEPESTAPPSY